MDQKGAGQRGKGTENTIQCHLDVLKSIPFIRNKSNPNQKWITSLMATGGSRQDM